MPSFTFAHRVTEAQRDTSAWQACLALRLSLEGRMPPSWVVVTGPEPGQDPMHLVYKPARRVASGGVTGETHKAGRDSPSDSEAALKIR